jgi:hypothetical protein
MGYDGVELARALRMTSRTGEVRDGRVGLTAVSASTINELLDDLEQTLDTIRKDRLPLYRDPVS